MSTIADSVSLAKMILKDACWTVERDLGDRRQMDEREKVVMLYTLLSLIREIHDGEDFLALL